SLKLLQSLEGRGDQTLLHYASSVVLERLGRREEARLYRDRALQGSPAVAELFELRERSARKLR
ncbi:MAG: hypothetical protein ACE5F1_19605, partial [Planctomycetota bacterium]